VWLLATVRSAEQTAVVEAAAFVMAVKYASRRDFVAIQIAMHNV